MTFKFNPNLREFFHTKADVKVLRGGRASGKSFAAAGYVVYLAANYSIRILAVRQFQNSIADSVYSLIVELIEEMGYQDEFEILKTEIRHRHTGSSMVFMGFQRNTASIKSLNGINLAYVEEAESLTAEQWQILEPTIREEGSEIWLVFNPQLSTDFVMTHFKHDPENGVIVRDFNYTENVFLPDKMKRMIAKAKDDDYELYRHIYLGEPKSDDNLTIIKRKWLMACIDAHKKTPVKQGKTRIGFDVAGDGRDDNCMVYADGNIITGVESWQAKEDEIFTSTKRVYKAARAFRRAKVVYDSCGLGNGCGSNINELNKQMKEKEGIAVWRVESISHDGFNAGGAVKHPNRPYNDKETNGQFFSNLKSQSWWFVRQLAMNTYNAVTKGYQFEPDEVMSLSSDIEELQELIDELSLPRMAESGASGKAMVEKKSDLEKRGHASPNRADSAIMALTPFAGKGRMIVG